MDNRLETNIEEFLTLLDLKGENFTETPRRIAAMWRKFRSTESEAPIIRTFSTQNNHPVVIKGHEAWGFCPHHLLPVLYNFEIGYTPKGVVMGLSKLARIAEYYLKDLPIQEELNVLIVDHIHQVIDAEEVYCAIEGFHLCCAMRGTKSDAKFYTHYRRSLCEPLSY